MLGRYVSIACQAFLTLIADDDCPKVPNAGQSTCNATRCCDVHCNAGYTLVDGQCHLNQQTSSSPSAGACRAFKGHQGYR